MRFSLFSTGAISLLAQVVILRELSVAGFGIELIYSLALGEWLPAAALGAWLARDRRLTSPTFINILFLIYGLTLPLDIAFIRGSRIIFGGVPGAYLSFPKQLLTASIAVIPLGFLSGLLYRQAARAFTAVKGSAAAAYGIESLGGVAGGLTATFAFHLGVQNLQVAFLCSLGAILASCITPVSAHFGRKVITGCSLGFIIIGLLAATKIDPILSSWNHPNIVEMLDTPYSRVTVTSLEDQLSVFENDALAFETQGTSADEFANLAAVQHPHPERILLLGGGFEGLVEELLKHNPRMIIYLELNAGLLNLVTRRLPEARRTPLNRKEVRIIIADPREYLDGNTTFDLILVAMPEPGSAQSNRYYTHDFFKQCAAALAPDGVLAFRLRAAENLWTRQMILRTGSIIKALRNSFKSTVILPGTTIIVLASPSELPLDFNLLASRIREREVTSRLVTDRYIRYLYTNDRFEEIKELMSDLSMPENSDNHPVCFQMTQVLWLSQFFPRLSNFEWSAVYERLRSSVTVKFTIILAVIALFLSSRSHLALRRTMLAVLAGFIGMVLETVLLLYYQAKTGVLYQDLGLLFTMFMMGLTVGALSSDYVIRSSFADHEPRKGLGILIFLLTAGFCLLTTYQIELNLGTSFPVIGSELVFSGFVTAALFGYAGRIGIAAQSKIAAPLYAADLVGGCLGSLAATFIFIPFLGLPVSSLTVCILAVFGLILV